MSHAEVLALLNVSGGKKMPPCAATFEDAGGVSLNTAFTHPTRFVLAFDVDAYPVGNILISFRRQDDANRHFLYISHTFDGGLIHLAKMVDNVQTDLAVNKVMGAVGKRVVMVVDGTSCIVYYNGAEVINVNTLVVNGHTGGMVSDLGEGGAISDLKVWHWNCRSQEGVGASIPWWMAGGAVPILAYAPKGAADANAALVNLAFPGVNNAAAGAAPSFNASTGWTFNGTSHFLTTGVIPQRNWTMMIRFASGSGTGSIAGSTRSTAEFYIKPINTGATGREYNYGSGIRTAGATATSGTIGLSHTACYYDGADDGTSSNATFGVAAYAAYLGARNNNGTAASFWAGAILAFYLCPSALSASQVSALHTAMLAL